MWTHASLSDGAAEAAVVEEPLERHACLGQLKEADALFLGASALLHNRHSRGLTDFAKLSLVRVM
jgi:hypothetical protein